MPDPAHVLYDDASDVLFAAQRLRATARREGAQAAMRLALQGQDAAHLLVLAPSSPALGRPAMGPDAHPGGSGADRAAEGQGFLFGRPLMVGSHPQRDRRRSG